MIFDLKEVIVRFIFVELNLLFMVLFYRVVFRDVDVFCR